MLRALLPKLPPKAPNHLLGIGDVPSLDALIPLGIDTFDSSYPTKLARHGSLLTEQGMVKILHKSQKNAFVPIDPSCHCYTCQHYTRAYLQHLFKAKEQSALTLATIHNLSFMVELMKKYRELIKINLI